MMATATSLSDVNIL